MWCTNFSDRMISWHQLRADCEQGPLRQSLERINAWWYHAPWSSYYLHWDDRGDWPNPWQLLEDNIYCSLARALGMLYTVSMLENRGDLDEIVLADVVNDNLVFVNDGKYILNWSADTIVNIHPGPQNPARSIRKQDLAHKIN